MTEIGKPFANKSAEWIEGYNAGISAFESELKHKRLRIVREERERYAKRWCAMPAGCGRIFNPPDTQCPVCNMGLKLLTPIPSGRHE